MATRETNLNDKAETKTSTDWKPGSDPTGGPEAKGDFGVHAGTSHRGEREYTSANTKAADPGNAQPMANEFDGNRTHGAGARASGDGSASGGDLDTDIIGVGTGGSGIAASGKLHPDSRPDDSDGTSGEFNSPVSESPNENVQIIPASGRNQTGVHQVGGDKRVPNGTVFTSPDVSTGGDAQGADAATNPDLRDDDSFKGEISSGEARGEDAPLANLDP